MAWAAYALALGSTTCQIKHETQYIMQEWLVQLCTKAPNALRGLRAGAPTGVRRKSATRNMNFRMPSRLAITAESEMAIVRPRYLRSQYYNITHSFIVHDLMMCFKTPIYN